MQQETVPYIFLALSVYKEVMVGSF